MIKTSHDNDCYSRLWVVDFRHLLGVQIEDYSGNTLDSCIIRNFDEMDLLNIHKGVLRLQYLKYVDENGLPLHYLDYMKKYYIDQYDIAENQYEIYG